MDSLHEFFWTAKKIIIWPPNHNFLWTPSKKKVQAKKEKKGGKKHSPPQENLGALQKQKKREKNGTLTETKFFVRIREKKFACKQKYIYFRFPIKFFFSLHGNGDTICIG